MSGKKYEDEFALEMAKAREGKSKATPWGSGYSKAPEILHGGGTALLLFPGGVHDHIQCGAASSCLSPGIIGLHAAGYTKKVKGKTAEERLDMRAAMKWVLCLLCAASKRCLCSPGLAACRPNC